MFPLYRYVGCYLFLVILLFSGCTSARLQADGPEIVAGRTKSTIKSKVETSLFQLPGYRTYFAILNETIYRIGQLRAGDSQLEMCRVRNIAELRSIIARIKKIESMNDNIEKTTALQGLQKICKPVKLTDAEELSLEIATLRQLTSEDGRERGSFLRMSEEKENYRLYLESSITVGIANEVSFSFPVNSSGNLTRKEKNGDLLVGTVHTHLHDKGLSGFTFNHQPDEKGDITNIKETGIPWIAVGPSYTEAGYLTPYGQVITEDAGNVNLALYALFRVAVDLQKRSTFP